MGEILMAKSKAERLRQWALGALNEHQAEGTLPTTGRHLFYEAVTAGIVKKSNKKGGRRPDQDLTDAATQLRERGLVPWSWLEDRTRNLLDYRGAADADAYMNAMVRQLTLDPWAEVLPVLVVESESVAGVLVDVAAEYRVVLVPLRGHVNGWLRTTVARRLDDERPLVVGYVGDYDKAGGDIEANARRVLAESVTLADWQRVALTERQVSEHNIELEDRLDRRTHRSNEAAEVEALPHRVLVAEVRSWLDGLLPEPLEHVHERERAERERLSDLLGGAA